MLIGMALAPCHAVETPAQGHDQPGHGDTGALIYQQGRTRSGQASLGNGGSPAPATLFPCINCHGPGAGGAKETGVVAPDITWPQLAQPYRRDPDGGYPRAIYDRSLFQRALTTGINSDGEPLSANMPRYELDDAEITALIAYLRGITAQAERGVTPEAIHFWLRLPDNPDLAEAMSTTVHAFTGQLNARGGIYRRQLQLHEWSQEQAAESAFGIIDLRMLAQQETSAEHITLGIFAARGAGDDAYFLYEHPAGFEQLQQEIVTERGWTIIDAARTGVARIIERLNRQDTGEDRFTVLIHRSHSMPIEQLLNQLIDAGRHPGILTDTLSLSQMQTASIRHYPAPIYLLTPPGPESVSAAGQTRYSQLASQAGFSSDHLRPRLWSLALMQLLVTALEQSGKDLTADLFAEVLQRQVDLKTDFGPPLTYSARRRTGHSGGILMRIN